MESNSVDSKKKPLFAFNADQSLLATCSADSRVKVWDARSSALVVDCTALSSASASAANEGFLGPFTSLAWLSIGANIEGERKRKNKSNSASPQKHLLAAGTTLGEVVAWDQSEGHVAWRTARGSPEDGVTALAAASGGGGVLWAGTRSGAVLEVNAASGEVLSSFSSGKATVASLAVSPNAARLLVGGSSLKLFDLPSRKRVWKATGHASAVAQCAFTPDGAYALSAGRNERHVAVWDCVGPDGQSSLGTLSGLEAVVSFACDAVQEAASEEASGEAVVRVLVATAGGEALMWCAAGVPALMKSKPTVFRPDSAAALALHKKGTSPSPKKELARSRVLAVALPPKTPGFVTLVRGSIARPRVERVPATSASLDASLDAKKGQRVVLLAPLEGGDLIPGAEGGAAAERDTKESKAALSTEPAVVSALPMGNGDVAVEEQGADQAPQEFGSAAKKKTKKKRKAEEAEDGVSGKADALGAKDADRVLPGLKEEGPGEESEEETLEEKLQSLGIGAGPGLGLRGEAAGKAPGEGEGSGMPRGDSLLVLLHQAVMAEDEKLLESCLGVTDESVIVNTVRRLQPQTAVKFLSVAVARLQSRPHRARALAPWLRALLLNHASLMMSSPGVQPVLMSLYQEVDARMALFQPLLSLSGRLDLLVSSIRKIQKQRGGKGAGEGEEVDELAGVAVYDEENDESDLEVEDATREVDAEDDEEEEEEEEDEGEEAEEEDGNEGYKGGAKHHEDGSDEDADDDEDEEGEDGDADEDDEDEDLEDVDDEDDHDDDE